MNNYIVYRLTSPSNKFYIGSTSNIKRRLKSHFKGINNGNAYIHYATEKYGKENINVEILCTCITREEAYKKEQEYLDKYFNDKLCVNFYPTAKGFCSETAKYARSKVKKIFALSEYMEANPELQKKKGQSLTQAYIDNPALNIKSSQAHRGYKYIEIISPENISLGRFESIKQLKNAYPQFLSSGHISSCANGKLKTYKKHKFIYTD
jgi:group I intron endonuclease